MLGWGWFLWSSCWWVSRGMEPTGKRLWLDESPKFSCGQYSVPQYKDCLCRLMVNCSQNSLNGYLIFWGGALVFAYVPWQSNAGAYGVDWTDTCLSVMFYNWFSCRKDLPSFCWMNNIRILGKGKLFSYIEKWICEPWILSNFPYISTKGRMFLDFRKYIQSVLVIIATILRKRKFMGGGLYLKIY